MFRNPSLFRHFHSVMKRSVTVEKVEVVKKVKVTKKKTWEPFDPSLPNNLTFPTSFDFPPKPEKSIKFASYNVASLQACIKKGFNSYVTAEDADVLCIQETKLNSPLKTAVDPKVYPYQYWSFHDKKGYAGVAIFSKHEPQKVTYGLPGHEEEYKGRVITLFFQHLVLIGSYVPNAGDKLVRLPERRVFNDRIERYIRSLQADAKPVVWAGDLNVAHTAEDLARPETNQRSAGFTIEERTDFGKVLAPSGSLPGLIDSWRHLHPTQKGHYTYYSYRFKCREKLIGWRLDYFAITPDLLDRLVSSEIRHEAWGASDHVPLVLTLKDIEL
ncbi:hypothetical protein G6F46_008612 [Rhizopus delemar]|uniref:Endonuclease/exonuclease/phosphatase domain-containing protein n=2 Tax=Rhizopus TaxID=4842 RepID=A0A9P6YYH2_9FUNG|nr:hypothetical protein G6F55_004548 [Rhizopus delemar]KAG1539817.1 hypothetical protein G6F51_008909 [Rhizopus arrhizus]KAG1494028.1 hypothetical protein G6F54_008169 [Rhizopus delemar]KAG1511727.1 hypothetical protein G6F53_005722 [Rhizopus delemar]KAG1519478.1 hypothetical protein G6F52_008582 [Rhizopus delemar]